MLISILSALLFFLLLIAFLGDLLQFVVRIAASIYDQPNLSTHLVSLSMLINRVGAASGLLLIGFFIDYGTPPQLMIGVYCAFSIALSLLYFATGWYASNLVSILRPVVMWYYKIEIDTLEQANQHRRLRSPPNDIAFIFLVALLGFLLPSVAAAIFPDFRATLLQTGFMLNSVATLYSTLKVEKDMAVTLNCNDTQKKMGAFVEFMLARSIGSLSAAIVLPLVLLFL